ncbi:MAG: DNA repair protein RecN, partial [Bacteroidota bacterium]
MLKNLSIANYALIDHLNVSFTSGFTVITGETGAGKSILLGGLSLVLGKRADLSSLRDKSNKCIVEAEFEVDKYHLKSFFKENDLDYDDLTIIRREILPSGKSRAFINDSPVTLQVLSQLGNSLIDVHSQHQTLQLADTDFQLKVIDALANNGDLLANYTLKLVQFQNASKALGQMREVQGKALKELDYNSFLLKELESAPLQPGILTTLEEQYEQLNNVEAILEQLSKGHQLLNDEQVGIIHLLTQLKLVSNKLSNFGNQFIDLNDRIQSIFIEVDDVAGELESLMGNVEANPAVLEEVGAKLQLLYDLQKKHNALDISELLVVKDELAKKVNTAVNIESDIKEKEAELEHLGKELKLLSDKISKQRKAVFPQLKNQLEIALSSLGMQNATFKIEVSPSSDFKANGKDDLTFLFSANKGTGYGELKKVASGGELSRIMLTIKSILAQYEHLPTLMFDEIDTGVSGEISTKMGDIMAHMSKTMQIFSITHLPQVASKGDYHYKVYKKDDDAITQTKMKKLTQE